MTSNPKKSFSFSTIINALIIAAIIYLLGTRIPTWISNYKKEGQPANSFQLVSLHPTQNSTLTELPPKDNRPSVLIFWATWCGPCHMELARVQKAILGKEIPADRVFAISLGEDPQTVQAFAQQKGYSFQVFADSQHSSRALFDVNGTPTTYHINADGTINWVSMGVNPLSITKAKALLN